MSAWQQVSANATVPDAVPKDSSVAESKSGLAEAEMEASEDTNANSVPEVKGEVTQSVNTSGEDVCSSTTSGLEVGAIQTSASSSSALPAPHQEASFLARRPRRSSLTLKVGMVGDAGCGKTSLMVRYCEGHFDEDYIMTLGVNFLERSVSLRRTDIVFSVWDLGGQSEFRTMLPLVTSDAAAMLFIFDLTRKPTLVSIRDWYQQVRLLNVTAVPILVGNKYDLFISLAADQQASMIRRARKYARAMHAPLVFCSASHSIHVQRVFKLVLVRLFDLQPTFERQTDPTRGPLCEW
ncbi:hypothetical protein CCYA_CCYA18G4498 [Cyanidiococcus yangmingshanensis]|nr:hypothetical protein CCYA_CCYA18G4498 [Cyanidiococcus yangmingshanensis]